jgi:predicted membrane protein
MNIPVVAPARAVPGGRSVSLMMTVIMGPAAYCVATATMILLRPTT